MSPDTDRRSQSTPSGTTYVFLDTNIFLHYQPIEQIKWQEVLKCDAVTLVVAPVVIRELDQHKDQHRLQAVRDRARTTLKRVLAVVQRRKLVELPDGVALMTSEEPSIDFAATGLVRDIADDHLIASCLAHRDAHPEARVTLVAHDTGPLIKATKRGIAAVELPHHYLLPDAQSSTEKELQRLRRRVAELESLSPDLMLSFADGSSHYRVQLPDPFEFGDNNIAEQMTALKLDYPKLSPEPRPTTRADDPLSILEKTLGSAATPSTEEYERYNTELDRYYERYQKYLTDLAVAKHLLGRTVRLDLVISNQGTAPADDLDVFIHFPDGFMVCPEEDRPTLPDEPVPPRRPRTWADMLATIDDMNGVLGNTQFGRLVHLPHPSPGGHMPKLNIKKTNSYDVTFSIAKLKHSIPEQVPPIYLVFEHVEAATSFGIKFRINAANVPKEVTGTLHVVVEHT